MHLQWLGRVAYRSAWLLQERLRAQVERGGEEVVLVCEHEPVITLGRSAQVEAELIADETTLLRAGIELVRTDRGGKATYHGPGQIVLYPIIRLRHGVLHHVERMAAAAISVAQSVNVSASFRREPVGVFVGARKLAAIGVRVQRRVATHGLALNMTSEVTDIFRRGLLVPCGVAGGQVTSLAEEGADPRPRLDELAARLAKAFIGG